MKQLEIVIRNQTGLHARPAKVLVNLAKQFKADIRIQCKDKRANAKSMVSVLTLGAACGSCVCIEANGEDEELALATLGEAIVGGLGDTDHPAAEPVAAAALEVSSAPAPGSLRGIGAAPGLAVGPVFQYRAHALSQENLDAPAVLGLDAALDQAKQQLAELHERMVGRKLKAEAAIFEAHSEFLEDQDLLASVKARLETGQSVARAWQAAFEEQAATIAALGDALLSARADDLRDVGHRVLRLLLGTPEKGIVLPDMPVVVLARELTPSETAAFDPARVLGFCIVNGGPTAHIAILARALGLPAIVGAEEPILELADGTLVVLDGSAGSLIPDPAPEVLAQAREAQNALAERRRQAQAQAGLAAVTRDGRHVDVTANAGSHANAVEAVKQGADGIGLLRTEFLFLDRETAPGEEEQFEVYRAIAETMATRPVIVRTLDIGGDKPVPYIHLKPEENPFLGERGIRLCLTHPDLFRDQLRGILRAAPFGNLQIMFPMISEITELRQAKALIQELSRELGAPPVQVGIMIEVPSAALLADKLAPEVDFFSIGTNDLTQYTLAMDRGHAGLASRQDGLHPAVLQLIARTVDAAHRFGKRADICGELGSDAAAIPILVGLGVDELSVSIPAVPTVKAQVRELDANAAKTLALKALECATAPEVRELVRAFRP
jgi:multiphosphoryl transfer protein